MELKNEIGQLRRGLDQMTTFAEYSHVTYLACTRYLAASYLDNHAEAKKVKHWDPHLLSRRIEAFGFRLLLVEGTTVTEFIAPKERAPERRKLDELKSTLAAMVNRAA